MLGHPLAAYTIELYRRPDATLPDQFVSRLYKLRLANVIAVTQAEVHRHPRRGELAETLYNYRIVETAIEGASQHGTPQSSQI